MNFIENESEQKLRGGYYTPLDLAVFITKWALEKKPKHILEPSCGDGVFVEALSKVKFPSNLSFTGFEIFEEEASKARSRCKALPRLKSTIHVDDYLGWAIKQMVGRKHLFDAAVGNPPFIRYQYLSKESQNKAEIIFKLLGLPFTKHTNAWVPFVLSSIAMLRPGGRLAMIIPAEVMHVLHAQSLRTYLGSECSRLLVIDPEEIWFENTLQGVVILLAEKKMSSSDHSHGLGIAEVRGRAFLDDNPANLFNETGRMNGKTVEGKWTRALLTTKERCLLDGLVELPEVHVFDSIAEVDVGIVTGANKFFLVNDQIVEEFKLQKWAHPMFGRSQHCGGVIYDEKQHKENSRLGNSNNFIWLKGDKDLFNDRVLSYLQAGEREGLPKRYKCRVRKPWYTVPSVYSTKIGMLKRAHNTHRLIYNKLDAFSTDTAYRIRAEKHSAEKLVYCFVNGLTALSAELEGRHYGGGVLELVPSEIEKMLIPFPKSVRAKLRRLDSLVREENATVVLEEQSKCVLGGLGVTKGDQDLILSAWSRLKNRRQRSRGSIDFD